MTSGQTSFFIENESDSRIIRRAALVAFVMELVILTAVGFDGHWLSHPKPFADDTSKFIEAQVFQLPEEAHLKEESKPLQARSKPEATLAKRPDQGRKAKPEENVLQEQNQTQAGAPTPPSHGPVAVFSPSPVIPSYLQSQDLHASVVIDFFVSAKGYASPRLVGSSGNEELDAIAINSAKKWRFRPAEKQRQAIDSKIRLRIVFEVK